MATRTRLLALAVSAAAALGACALQHDDTGTAESEMNPIDRLVVGRAMQYPADSSLNDRQREMAASQVVRRDVAWKVARKILSPVKVDSGSLSVPLFQTWYAKEEVLPMFDRVLRGMAPADLAAHAMPSDQAISDALLWEATRATSMPDFTQARLDQRRQELETQGTSSLGGPERVLMSPEFVGHIMTNYDAILKCMRNFPAPNAPPPAEDNFAPCVGAEFGSSAVVVKARWVPDSLPMEVWDTNAESLSKTLAAGTWGEAARTVTPTDDEIYTMRMPTGLKMRLAAIHILTKELRDWMWVSLFWSDKPTADFGADRPGGFEGPFAHYKMCTVVDYDEHDDGTSTVKDPSLASALAASRKFGPRSWCSNPYLEHGDHNATTNCIGCHQHAGTDLTTETILGGRHPVPDGSREKTRTNFPADYTFTTTTGLGLGNLLKAKVDQLTGN